LTEKVIALNIKPGIQRDGTLFDAPCYVDGQWMRFQRGRPRKIGGYRDIFQNASGISRGMIMNSQDGLNYVYSGWSNGVQEWQTDDDDGVGAGPANIALTNFTSSAQNLWQFDIGYDSNGSGANTIVGHPGLNLSHIDNTINTPVLIGTFPGGAMSAVKDTAGTTPTGATISVSGGCVFLHPYLFVYGNDGLIKNCSAGNFQDWNSADSNENNVATGKIVKGMPVRGGTTSPAGLFWSLDSLIRVSYAPQSVGTSTTYWKYDIISSQTSILSSSSVIEYDGIFFWCGVDRFLMYNGVVQELPNQMNLNTFFDNLNYTQRQKVWASKVPRWGEIWWFYPKGDATECTDAVIFNVRDRVWYDAGEALGAHRSAGTFSEVFRKPIWAGTDANSSSKYTLWQHETGVNVIENGVQSAVLSYFETNNIGWVTGGPGADQPMGQNRWADLSRIEPDFIQSGEMSVIVTGKGYANDEDVPSDPYYFDPDTLKIDLREQRREMRLRFQSNVVNGNYETGQNLLSIDVGDERGTGNP
jgi:hypothetical protein